MEGGSQVRSLCRALEPEYSGSARCPCSYPLLWKPRTRMNLSLPEYFDFQQEDDDEEDSDGCLVRHLRGLDVR